MVEKLYILRSVPESRDHAKPLLPFVLPLDYFGEHTIIYVSPNFWYMWLEIVCHQNKESVARIGDMGPTFREAVTWELYTLPSIHKKVANLVSSPAREQCASVSMSGMATQLGTTPWPKTLDNRRRGLLIKRQVFTWAALGVRGGRTRPSSGTGGVPFPQAPWGACSANLRAGGVHFPRASGMRAFFRPSCTVGGVFFTPPPWMTCSAAVKSTKGGLPAAISPFVCLYVQI